MFATAKLLASRLAFSGEREAVIQQLIAAMHMQAGHIDIELKPDALGVPTCDKLLWRVPLPRRKPFREAKIRMDAEAQGLKVNDDLVALLAEAHGAHQLVRANPELSLNQLAKRENRCRTHLARLMRIGWLGPTIVEAIVRGAQPVTLNRKVLLAASIASDWNDQERMLGFAA